MSQLTTHVLDTALGRPAAGVPVVLEALAGGSWTLVASGSTDVDGRARSLGPDLVAAGRYRFVFDTGAYFSATGQAGFLPAVTVEFVVVGGGEHYHVPVLLSPFAYSTYRGS